VCYASTDEGVELPVIDVTHPAFHLELSAEDMASGFRTHLAMMGRRRVPVWLLRLWAHLVARRSPLVRGVVGAAGGFLGGMDTYLLKLGPANLDPGLFSGMDRKVAGSFPALAARIRLQEAARRMARGLGPALAARPAGPLHFVNIAGGPALDSLNALILLRRRHPEWLEGRQVHIHVLDLQREAPRFGQRALAALGAEGGPLHGLAVTFRHLDYDWSDPRVLRELLAGLEPGSVVAASSEGGLFNYGSDQAIGANLAALRAGTPADCPVVASVAWDTELQRPARRFSRIASRNFTPGQFEALVRSTGWELERGVPSPTRQVVCLMQVPQ
jgi:hypothetical protein